MDALTFHQLTGLELTKCTFIDRSSDCVDVLSTMSCLEDLTIDRTNVYGTGHAYEPVLLPSLCRLVSHNSFDFQRFLAPASTLHTLDFGIWNMEELAITAEFVRRSASELKELSLFCGGRCLLIQCILRVS
jgi:hypothetical protein